MILKLDEKIDNKDYTEGRYENYQPSNATLLRRTWINLNQHLSVIRLLHKHSIQYVQYSTAMWFINTKSLYKKLTVKVN